MKNHKLKFYHPHFETALREQLDIYDRELTAEDAYRVTELNCWDYCFRAEDVDTLCQFKNLKELDICTNDLQKMQFPKGLCRLELECTQSFLDLQYLQDLKNMDNLFLTGGDLSGMEIIHVEALKNMPRLRVLGFHEFGTVDLLPLQDMLQMESFFCGYAEKVKNAQAIGYLTNLTDLELVDVDLEDVDFLDKLPDTMRLELCAVRIQKPTQLCKLTRFAEYSLESVTINGELMFCGEALRSGGNNENL